MSETVSKTRFKARALVEPSRALLALRGTVARYDAPTEPVWDTGTPDAIG